MATGTASDRSRWVTKTFERLAGASPSGDELVPAALHSVRDQILLAREDLFVRIVGERLDSHHA